jgi:hypothetical protein
VTSTLGIRVGVRRRGRAYEFDERRFLTREQLTRLLAEIPDGWRPFFDLDRRRPTVRRP